MKETITFRVMRVVRQAVDIEVPSEIYAEGMEAAREYAAKKATKALEDRLLDVRIEDGDNVKDIVICTDAYLKQPYPEISND